MNIWLLFLIMGVLTFLERISFTVLLENWNTPGWLTRSLRYVPVTVLLALSVPVFLRTDGMIDLSLNPKIIAAIIAAVVAWRTRNLFLTILLGMLGFWLSQALLG